jgi:hypothetical protein
MKNGEKIPASYSINKGKIILKEEVKNEDTKRKFGYQKTTYVETGVLDVTQVAYLCNSSSQFTKFPVLTADEDKIIFPVAIAFGDVILYQDINCVSGYNGTTSCTSNLYIGDSASKEVSFIGSNAVVKFNFKDEREALIRYLGDDPTIKAEILSDDYKFSYDNIRITVLRYLLRKYHKIEDREQTGQAVIYARKSKVPPSKIRIDETEYTLTPGKKLTIESAAFYSFPVDFSNNIHEDALLWVTPEYTKYYQVVERYADNRKYKYYTLKEMSSKKALMDLARIKD